jgi:hypothetical protein
MLAGFSMGIPFVVYMSLRSDPTQDVDGLRSIVLLENAPATALGSYPMFGAAIMLVIGVLVAGPEFRWGTWTARFSQGPSRAEVVMAKASVAIITTGIVVAVALIAAIVVSAALTLSLGSTTTFPGLGSLVTCFGASWAISAAWAIVGLGTSIVFRGTMAPVAVGLVWILAVENIVAGLATMLTWFAPVRWLTLGAASGSLAAAAGADASTPGVAGVLNPVMAALLIIVYCIVFCGVAVILMKRRDITDNR